MDLAAEAARTGGRLRVLVSRLRYLGDVILTTPVIAALKRRYPDAELYYLAEAPYASIVEGNPDLTGVFALHAGATAALRMIGRIRRTRFTAALDLFYNPRSAVLLYLSGIPIRIGGSRRLRRRLYTGTFTIPRDVRSAVAHHLYPLRLFGVNERDGLPRIHLRATELESGARLLAQTACRRDEGEPVIAIHPGGTWPAKRWDQAAFARASIMLRERLGARILIVTGPGEGRTAGAVASGIGDRAFVLPTQPLRMLAAVLAGCSAVVANDGGVLHMAVALGTPTVGIFGPTEPEIWFPYGGKGPFAVVSLREACAPCHRHHCEDLRCLKKIDPDRVVHAVEQILRSRG